MMRYWGILLAKLAGVSLVLGAGWIAIHSMGSGSAAGQKYPLPPFGTDLGYTMLIMLLWLLGVGLFYASVWDQRYRCRTCGRRLHMPVSSGGWNSDRMGPCRKLPSRPGPSRKFSAFRAGGVSRMIRS